MQTKKAIQQFALATITLLGAGYLHVAGAEPEPGKPLTKTPLEENKNKTTTPGRPAGARKVFLEGIFIPSRERKS